MLVIQIQLLIPTIVKSRQYKNVGQKLFAQLLRLGKKNNTTSWHNCLTNIDPGAKNDNIRSKKISRALIWCKVRLCRPNMTRDMIKKKKQGFSLMLQKCKIWHFLKITVLMFFIISLIIFGLQRCTLSQIKALEILFWPCFIIFSPRINICWAIMSRSCQRFFYPVFSMNLKNIVARGVV